MISDFKSRFNAVLKAAMQETFETSPTEAPMWFFHLCSNVIPNGPTDIGTDGRIYRRSDGQTDGW